MGDLPQQLSLLTYIFGLTAVFWGLCALSAFANYRAFLQRLDLAWVATFVAMALVRLGYAWEARTWAGSLDLVGRSVDNLIASTTYLRMRFAACELVAVIALFLLFRARRSIV